MGERIMGYIHVKKGPHEALLVATDERFIVGWTWRHGLLFRLLVPWPLRLVFPIRKAGKLKKLSPDQILNADDHNFAIAFSDVVGVKVWGLLGPKIVIVTSDSEYRFELTSEKRELYYFEDYMRPYLTDKLSIREN